VNLRKAVPVLASVLAFVSVFAVSGAADQGSRRNGVNVVEATYGGTLVPIFNDCAPVATGNVTAPVHDACQGQKTCTFAVDQTVIGDPAFGCWKSFEVTYQCAEDRNATRTVSIPADPDGADGKTVVMSCPIK